MPKRTLWLAVLLVCFAGSGLADSIVQFSVLGPTYSLKVTANANDTIIGVIVENGFTVFGVTPSSTIQAPMNWTFFAPLDSVDDALFYLSNSGDILPNTSLGGFTFNSAATPAPFQVGLVTLTGTEQVMAVPAAEPSSALLLAIGFGLLAVRPLSNLRRRR
jgi:hypothetical protein